jgi:sugar O-acyltransferase (sialic acid O-acetyltransferase NeuD family)
MQIEKLVVLGLSVPTLTMLTDNLESLGLFPRIKIINNLEINNLKDYQNSLFSYELAHAPDNTETNPYYFLGVNRPPAKLAVFALYKHLLKNPINIIHGSSSLSSTVKLSNGILINSLVSVAAFAELGKFVSINRNASVGHHTVLEDFVTVNPGANIAGNIRIGHGSQIGMGVNIIDGIRVGSNTVVGAGSLVTKDLPDNVIAYGSPCKIIKQNETQSI